MASLVNAMATNIALVVKVSVENFFPYNSKRTSKPRACKLVVATCWRGSAIAPTTRAATKGSVVCMVVYQRDSRIDSIKMCKGRVYSYENRRLKCPENTCFAKDRHFILITYGLRVELCLHYTFQSYLHELLTT